MPLADVEITDDPYTTYMLTDTELKAAAALKGLGTETLFQLARIGEGVVEAILNAPQDVDGNRHLARASYRETITFDRDRQHYTLARPPVTLTAVTLDGMDLEFDELSLHPSTGLISPKSGIWPCGAKAVFEYAGGWRTPAQAAQGAAANYGPGMPSAIIQAAVRGAQIAYSSLSREDIGVRSSREADDDAGAIETVYAAPPAQAGQDAEIFRLLAPWRRLVLS